MGRHAVPRDPWSNARLHAADLRSQASSGFSGDMFSKAVVPKGYLLNNVKPAWMPGWFALTVIAQETTTGVSGAGSLTTKIPPHVEPPVPKVGLQTQLGNDTTAVVGQIIFDAVPAALAPSPGH